MLHMIYLLISNGSTQLKYVGNRTWCGHPSWFLPITSYGGIMQMIFKCDDVDQVPANNAGWAFNMQFSRSLWTTPTLILKMPLINCYTCRFDNSCRIICMLYYKSSGCVLLLYRYLLYFKCYLRAPSALLADIALITVKWCDSWLITCLRIKIRPTQKSMITPGTFLLYYLTEKSYINPMNMFERS